jgi:TRAP-type C4-dicarboxylate transport system permease small subunit
MLRFTRLLEIVARWIVISTATVMVVAAIVQVIFRYILNYPLGWSEELARVMMVWWAFLAVGILASQRKMLSVDALLLVLPHRGVHALSAFAHLFSAFFMFWLGWLGTSLVGLAGTQSSPALQIPYALIYLSLPVGMLLAGICLLVNGLEDLRRLWRNEPANTSVIGEEFT